MNLEAKAYIAGWHAGMTTKVYAPMNPYASKGESRRLYSAWNVGFLDSRLAEDGDQPESEYWGYGDE